MVDSIFVSIICFKDRDIINTVRDMLYQAADPRRITIGIILQEDEDQLCHYNALKFNRQVKLKTFPVSWAEGCGKARFEALTLYDGQSYIYQSDAHMRFDRCWDQLLIDEIKRCESDLPILSTLPPNFDPITEIKNPPSYNELALYRFFRHIPLHIARIHALDDVKRLDSPKVMPFIAGGVFFSYGKTFEIKPDPYFYFHGEEFTMNLRLWTNGYTSFAPRFNFCYHAYRPATTKRVVSLDNIDAKKDAYLHERSMSRYQFLLNLKKRYELPNDHLIDIEKYGFGKVRTVRDWENAYGIWIREEEAEQRAYGLIS